MRNLSWMSRLMRGRPGTSSTKRLPTRGGPGGHHEEEVFNEPGGKLFGEEPLKPGERRKWEDWELPWYVFCAGCAFFAYSAIFVRDNAPWNAWAEEEVRIRHAKRAADYKARLAAEAAEAEASD